MTFHQVFIEWKQLKAENEQLHAKVEELKKDMATAIPLLEKAKDMNMQLAQARIIITEMHKALDGRCGFDEDIVFRQAEHFIKETK